MNDQQVLIIGHQWISPNASAAGTRMLQLIEIFLATGFEVCFACAAQKSAYSHDFSNSKVKEVHINLNDDAFDDFLRDLQPKIVVFDRFISEEQYGWRVAAVLPNALRILDTEDLHFLRKARQSAHKANRALQTEDFQTDIAFREIAAIFRSDLTLIISKEEMKLLTEHFKIPPKLLHYLPLFAKVLSEKDRATIPHVQQRKDFFFIGNFLHEPNWDAVLYLKKDIWPLLSSLLPLARLHIYGAFASQKVTDLHQPKERFFVHGHASNAEEVFYQHRMLLAPLRFGAGIKGKLILSMETGTPSITTSMGAEGISFDNQWNGAVKNNPIDFAHAAAFLYENESAWQNAQKIGFEILATSFHQNDFKWSFINKITESIQTLNFNRQENFVGQMLQHQSLQSTKYLSLWIQEKQKNKASY